MTFSPWTRESERASQSPCLALVISTSECLRTRRERPSDPSRGRPRPRMTVTTIGTLGHVPSRRGYHALESIGNNLFLIGGRAGEGDNREARSASASLARGAADHHLLAAYSLALAARACGRLLRRSLQTLSLRPTCFPSAQGVGP